MDQSGTLLSSILNYLLCIDNASFLNIQKQVTWCGGCLTADNATMHPGFEPWLFSMAGAITSPQHRSVASEMNCSILEVRPSSAVRGASWRWRARVPAQFVTYGCCVLSVTWPALAFLDSNHRPFPLRPCAVSSATFETTGSTIHATAYTVPIFGLVAHGPNFTIVREYQIRPNQRNKSEPCGQYGHEKEVRLIRTDFSEDCETGSVSGKIKHN